MILGLETSCDETAAAVVEDGRRVLSNVIASQHGLHEEYAGVVPEIASRAHVERLVPVVQRALNEAHLTWREIDAVAVGHRPGLIGSLLVGVSAAKALAWSLGIPIIGVDHVLAHLYAGLLDRQTPCATQIYPALGLVVSGGHTAIYTCASQVQCRRVGTTIDDAIGEAYDKVATILHLGYPGGPALDALARQPGADERTHDFPISRLSPDSLDFSFSGLKTAVLYAVRGVPGPGGAFDHDASALSADQRRDIAASFQRAACAAIVIKLERAIDQYPDCRTLLVGGGVSANSRLRADLEALAKARGLALVLASPIHCTDNAAMIAGLAYHLLAAGQASDLTLSAQPTTAC